jgi:hypothetical protein
VSGLLRRAEVEGGFAMGTAAVTLDRGRSGLLIASASATSPALSADLAENGNIMAIHWSGSVRLQNRETWSQKRRSYDPDLWLIELDVASPERFIAETIAIG